jgi:uncharacterized protein (TIGR02265 family)
MSTGNDEREVSLEHWVQELERRIALATPADTVRGLFIQSSLLAIRELGDAALVERCREACGHERFVDLFRYPISLQLRMLSVALEQLASRHGGGAQALRLIGHRAVMDFLESVPGRTVLVVAGGDPKRLLTSVPSAYRLATSFGEHTMRWTGPGQVLWKLTGEFMPYPFHEGTLTGVLAKTVARNVKVSGRQTGPLDCECDISWQ